MTRYMCIGNGPSRKGIDLNILKRYTYYPITIGCNYVYKEFKCNYVSLWDIDVLKTVVNEVNYSELIIPDPIDRESMGLSNTGYFSIWWAINKAKAEEIHLVGFDHLKKNDSGETLTDHIIKKHHGYNKNCTQSKTQRLYRGNTIVDLIKSAPEVKFVIWFPTRSKGILSLTECPNATIKTVPKNSKLNKMMKSINEALMVA